MCMSKEHNSFCEDKLSSLPDEMLIMILGKLDPRTTITTTVLSKRWLDLPRRPHKCYDLSIYEVLPPRYHRLKKITMEAKAGYEAEKKAQNLTDSCAFKNQYDRFYAIRDQYERWMGKVRLLTPILQRYERLAMRRYVKRVNAFLLPPNNVQQRSTQKLRLQTFSTSSFEQWITAAIGRWGVEDLEIIIESSWQLYDFRLLDGCQNVRLKRLVLSNCYHIGRAPLIFQRLTTLTLCYNSSRIHFVYDILINCVQLVDLKLKNSLYHGQAYRFNFPVSKLKNLQLYNCSVWKIYLTSLPFLETFAFRGRPAKLEYGEVPQLRHVSLDFLETGDNGDNEDLRRKSTYALGKFFKGTPPPLEYLVLQLRGPQMWIEPTFIPSQFNHLNKLFIANVPRSWDAFWIFILFAAAPFLQSLHVHFDNKAEKASAAGSLDVQVEQTQRHRHRHLRELVVIGFDGSAWQTSFVKRIMRASRWLGRVHLLDGHVVEDEERGIVDLEVVPRRREWHECERSEVLEELTDGTGFPQHKIVLE